MIASAKSYWQRFAWWLIAVFAHLKRGAGGHLLHSVDGHLVKDCSSDVGDCACDADHYTITFADIEGGVGVCCNSSRDSALVMNGTFDLDVLDNPFCAFKKVVTAGARHYSIAGCSGTETDMDTTISIDLVVGDPFGLHAVQIDHIKGAAIGDAAIFRASYETGYCSLQKSGFTAPNALTHCNQVSGSLIAVAYNGTATVTKVM